MSRSAPERPGRRNDPHLQGLIEQANSSADPAQAASLYSDAQRLIGDNALSIGLYTQTTSLASNPKLHDVWIEKSQGEPVFADARFVR